MTVLRRANGGILNSYLPDPGSHRATRSSSRYVPPCRTGHCGGSIGTWV
jgi:hypothetical protein